MNKYDAAHALREIRVFYLQMKTKKSSDKQKKFIDERVAALTFAIIELEK